MSYLKSFTKLIHKKKALLKCIFTTLLFQVLVTTLAFIGVYRNDRKNDDGNEKQPSKNERRLSWVMLLSFLALAIGLIILMTSFNFTFNERVAMFTLFSLLQGLFLGMCLKFIDANIIFTALFSTFAIFLLMIMIGFGVVYFKQDLSWLGIFLFIILLGVIITRIINLFIPYTSGFNKALALGVILLFSIYIVYDTNVILFRYNAINYQRDCILGALDYYLDLLNIFVNINSYMVLE